MSIETLPLVTRPREIPLVLCGAACDTDRPASFEDNYTLDPELDPTVDEPTGATLARCHRQACIDANLEYIATVGEYTGTTPIAQHVTCSDCGTTSMIEPGRRGHECGAPGNPTPWRVGQPVTIPGTDGPLHGTIRALRIPRQLRAEAEVYVPAAGFRCFWVGLDQLERAEEAAA